MTPWVLSRPSQFRLQGPPALDSAVYKADISEVNTMGVFSGSGRSSDQSELARFWNGNTPLYWNRIAAQISTGRGLSLAENARLFAVLNVAMADAAIACWDGKYRYIKNEGRPRRSSSVKVRQQPVVHRITNKTTCVSDKRARPRP
jgi:hypothetical protein